jgi:hypothetical protein
VTDGITELMGFGAQVPRHLLELLDGAFVGGALRPEEVQLQASIIDTDFPELLSCWLVDSSFIAGESFDFSN